VEMRLGLAGVPHRAGGVQAAIEYLRDGESRVRDDFRRGPGQLRPTSQESRLRPYLKVPQVLFPGKAHVGRRLAQTVRQESGEGAIELAGNRRRTVQHRLDLP